MAIRSYPDVEGYRDSNGNPYPLVPTGTVREELKKWAQAFINRCHELGWYFEPTSLNTGRHTPESMHYRGLAIDFNCKEANGNWVDFKTQSDEAANIANSLGYDIWVWASDDNNHTHLSLHPAPIEEKS